MLLNLEKAAPLMHMRLFNTTDGQVHVFFTGTESRTYNVPFPPGAVDALGRPVADEEE